MALQSSGAISLSQIQTEFGGSNPISLNEYYSAADGIPSSGTISMNQFYGKSAVPPGPLQWAGTTMWWYEYFPNGTSGRAQYAYAYSEFLKYFISNKGTTIQQMYFYFGSSSNKGSPTYTVTSNVQSYRSALINNGTYGSGTGTAPFLGRGCGNDGTYNLTGKNSASWHFNNSVACNCDAAGNPVMRPHIGNQNWGGINGGCNQPSQWMGIGVWPAYQ